MTNPAPVGAGPGAGVARRDAVLEGAPIVKRLPRRRHHFFIPDRQAAGPAGAGMVAVGRVG